MDKSSFFNWPEQNKGTNSCNGSDAEIRDIQVEKEELSSQKGEQNFTLEVPCTAAQNNETSQKDSTAKIKAPLLKGAPIFHSLEYSNTSVTSTEVNSCPSFSLGDYAFPPIAFSDVKKSSGNLDVPGEGQLSVSLTREGDNNSLTVSREKRPPIRIKTPDVNLGINLNKPVLAEQKKKFTVDSILRKTTFDNRDNKYLNQSYFYRYKDGLRTESKQLVVDLVWPLYCDFVEKVKNCKARSSFEISVPDFLQQASAALETANESKLVLLFAQFISSLKKTRKCKSNTNGVWHEMACFFTIRVSQISKTEKKCEEDERYRKILVSILPESLCCSEEEDKARARLFLSSILFLFNLMYYELDSTRAYNLADDTIAWMNFFNPFRHVFCEYPKFPHGKAKELGWNHIWNATLVVAMLYATTKNQSGLGEQPQSILDTFLEEASEKLESSAGGDPLLDQALQEMQEVTNSRYLPDSVLEFLR